MTDPQPPGDESVDPALIATVHELELHAAELGWDQKSRLYALARTVDLAAREPELARALGLDGDAADDSLIPIEQELDASVEFETILASITWPPEVEGCATVVERLVLPPEVDAEIPEDPQAALEFAQEHPDRQEVRIVVAARRGGATYCALRLRAHDEDTSVVGGPDLVPEMIAMLRATLEGDAPEEMPT
ncbi:PPA1309 family protein [Nocardioides sp. AE5]|uniref:PPA1309 family protein n=1 Tax=Nocardioides sp. AE5 TaxID=2962573 RepID=UPI002882156C|nr:PPA1309 family protein [Nocardioides sp. AE5]MDT0203877.1 PPA1309 family protein [Nocardioides sp. AE5]